MNALLYTCKTCTTSTQAPLAGQFDTPTYMFYQNLKLKTRTQLSFGFWRKKKEFCGRSSYLKLCDLLLRIRLKVPIVQSSCSNDLHHDIYF